MFASDVYFIQLLAWVWLHFAWQGVFVAVSARTCEVVFRESTSSFRYRVFCVHLAALALAPLVTLLVAHHAVVSYSPPSVTPPFSAVRWLTSATPSLLLPPFHLLAWAAPYVLLLWALGILIGGALLAGGRAHGSHQPRVSRARGRLLEVVDDLAQKLRLQVPPAIFEADVESPFVVGVKKQRLILPAEFERRLPPEELRAILAHELAHVKRKDYGSNLVQTALMLLLWPHPAAWVIWAQLREEREACCDEAAVQVCGSALPLARALYRMAVKGQPLDMAVAAASGPLARRLERLLSANPPAAPGLSWIAPAFAIVALALATSRLAQTLGADAATREALIASSLGPTISVRATDPAGSFRVKLRRGRVLGVSIENESIPAQRVIQQGRTVRVLSGAGQELLALQVDPRGGISWHPRARRGPSSL